MKIQKEIIYKKGSYVYIEGDEDVNEVFIVEKGKIELKYTNKYVKRHKDYAAPGDLFGFISALSNRPQVESAIASVDSTIAVFSRENFLTLLQKNAEISIKIINYFADELRNYDNMIFSLNDNKKIIPSDIRFFNLGKYYFNESLYDNAYYILLRYLQLYPDSNEIDEARTIIREIESTGIRIISEPIKERIYSKYMDKQVIFCENEPGEELFIIKKGKVKIVKFSNNTEIMLSVLNEGDIFGELAIVSDKPRNATAISYGNTTLLPINKNSLIKLLSRSSEILKRIFTSISQRVWFTYIRVEAMLYENPLTKIYAFLENKLLEEKISLKSVDPFTFNFGIDELLLMTNLSQEKAGSTIDDFLEDQNISFNFGKIKIENPAIISDRAKFFRMRDHLSPSGKESPPPEEFESKESSESQILSELDELYDSEV